MTTNRIHNFWFLLVSGLMAALVLQSFAMTMTPHGYLRDIVALAAVGLVVFAVFVLVLNQMIRLAGIVALAATMFVWRFSASLPDVQARGLIWVVVLVLSAFVVEHLQPISWLTRSWAHPRNPMHISSS